MAKLTNEEKLRRREKARQILNDELMVEAFEKLDQTYFEVFRRPELSPEAIMGCYLACQASREVRQHLTAVINSGRVAQQDMEEMAKKGKNKNVIPLSGAPRPA